jgi:hypothetical protein
VNQQLHVHSAECGCSCDMHRGECAYLGEGCNKVFGERSHLITHQQVNSVERPYTCDVCNKAFSQKSNISEERRVGKECQSVCSYLW